MTLRRLARGAASLLVPILLAAGTASAQTVQTGNVFNPNISVIGNALGIAGHNPVDNQPSLQLRESEIGLPAIVDPYARADFFVTFGSQTGDVGIDDAGISVSRLIPMPSEIFLEATAQLFQGTSANLFEAHTRNDVEPLFHLKAYRDLSESTNLELGGSWTRGNGVEGPGFHTTLAGADLTFRWKPLQQGLYRSILVRGEWMHSEREMASGATVRADGWYALGQYQLGRRWFAGYRHDEADHADAAALHDRGDSAILTFWPSEFSQLRAQLRRNHYDQPGGPVTATELLVQLQFVIGAHGAHPF